MTTMDARKLRLGKALDNVDKFRMPTGVKSQQWLSRADSAVRLRGWTRWGCWEFITLTVVLSSSIKRFPKCGRRQEKLSGSCT